MEPIRLTATTRDFYDRLNDPKRLVLGLGGLLLLTACLMLTPVWWPDDKFFLLMSLVMVPAILLGLPRIFRGALLAYRGAPALRINESGFWARSWSYLGWINWRDVASVEIVSGPTGKVHRLEIHLEDKKFAQLAGHDQASVMLARLVGFLFFTNAGPNTLHLTNSLGLTSSWEDFMETLDPILAANGVPRVEKTNSRLD